MVEATLNIHLMTDRVYHGVIDKIVEYKFLYMEKRKLGETI